MPYPCYATTMPFWKRLLKATAQRGMGAEWEWHGMCELASAVHRLRLVTCPRSASSGFHLEFHVGCYQKHNNSFGYFRLSRGLSHEENGRGAAWHVWINAARHGRGMAYVNWPLIVHCYKLSSGMYAFISVFIAFRLDQRLACKEELCFLELVVGHTLQLELCRENLDVENSQKYVWYLLVVVNFVTTFQVWIPPEFRFECSLMQKSRIACGPRGVSGSGDRIRREMYTMHAVRNICVGLAKISPFLLGRFEKLRKATVSFVMSVCPRATTRLPLDPFSWNMIFDYFLKIYPESSKFIKIWLE
jgi:hypothetical protein